MNHEERAEGYLFFLKIVTWGSLWGMFEATVGYLLHLLPVSIGWLVWVPVACFFMTNVYRSTKRVSSVLWVGGLSASVKMLDLLLPGRIDRVINPAVSVIFEALALTAVIYVLRRLLTGRQGRPLIQAIAALGMNTGWRILYILYLLFLVPDWIRDVSVISSTDQFIRFFVTQNLITSLVLFIGFRYRKIIMRPVAAAEEGIAAARAGIPARVIPAVRAGMAAVMLCADAALSFWL